MKTLQRAARVSRPVPRLSLSGFVLLTLLMIPLAAHAQSGTPFDSGLTSIQNLFTGTVAKVASLVAIVLGGYAFAHGEPGAKNWRNDYVAVEQWSRNIIRGHYVYLFALHEQHERFAKTWDNNLRLQGFAEVFTDKCILG